MIGSAYIIYTIRVDRDYYDDISIDVKYDKLILTSEREDFKEYVSKYANIPLEDTNNYTFEECIQILSKILEASFNDDIKECINEYNTYKEKILEVEKREEKHRKIEKIQNALCWLILFE